MQLGKGEEAMGIQTEICLQIRSLQLIEARLGPPQNHMQTSVCVSVTSAFSREKVHRSPLTLQTIGSHLSFAQLVTFQYISLYLLFWFDFFFCDEIPEQKAI